MDLKKAFDMANHKLLYALLARYRAPDSLIDVICQLHDDFKLNLKLSDEERNILYTTGVTSSLPLSNASICRNTQKQMERRLAALSHTIYLP